MTRAEILSRYDTHDSIVVAPGKFEGEPIYVVHFYEQMLDGGGDETFYGNDGNDIPVEVFVVAAGDRTEFPELDDTAVLWLWERSDGFVERREFASVKAAAREQARVEVENDTDGKEG